MILKFLLAVWLLQLLIACLLLAWYGLGQVRRFVIVRMRAVRIVRLRAVGEEG